MKKIALFFAMLSAIVVAEAQPLKVSINPDQKHQTIEYWAAADAWSGNFVGKYWSETAKQKIADWLFSQEYDESGNPKGAGLSAWRVNLGGGTLESPNCDIFPYHRRAECYLTLDGKNYDWGKCAGQEYWMTEAVKRGSNYFILFSNSPLVHYTLNGKGYTDDGKVANIKEDCYDDFARYMVDVAAHYMDKGWNVPYISPTNEPQSKWNEPRQEGSVWRNSELKRIMVELDKELSRDKRFDNVRLQLGETSRVTYLHEKRDRYIERYGEVEAQHMVVQNFFDKASQFYIGNLRHLKPAVYAHDYHDIRSSNKIREVHRKAYEECRKYGVEYNMSEWCLLPGAHKKNIEGFTKDWYCANYADMQTALLMARLIYSDMVDSNAASWSYWKGMELRGDHALIALHAKEGDIFRGGDVKANKLLYALGNYSFFIRPNYQRVALSGADNLSEVAATAYLSPDGKRLVAVYVNNTFEKRAVEVALPKTLRQQIASSKMYITDERNDLSAHEMADAMAFSINARSVTTIVYNLK
ncbi:MAG: hypothetical protein E7141_03640 [Rikenellaceae bacterium]|nr:hypothetical protein [Rikenellaceae bacterium]